MKQIITIGGLLADQNGNFSSKRGTLAVFVILFWRIVANVIRTGVEFPDKDILWFITGLIALLVGAVTSEFLMKTLGQRQKDALLRGHPQKPTKPTEPKPEQE